MGPNDRPEYQRYALWDSCRSAPHAEAEGGHIINTASVFGIKVFAPGGTFYCATKAAIRTLTEGLRMEVHADKIRNTIISPERSTLS